MPFERFESAGKFRCWGVSGAARLCLVGARVSEPFKGCFAARHARSQGPVHGAGPNRGRGSMSRRPHGGVRTLPSRGIGIGTVVGQM